MAGLLEYTKNGQVTEPPLYRFMRGNVQSFLNSIPDPSKLSKKEQLDLAANITPTMGLLGGIKEVLPELYPYAQQRLIQAADLVPNLEKQYSDKALKNAFGGGRVENKGNLFTVIDPAKFTQYSLPLPETPRMPMYMDLAKEDVFKNPIADTQEEYMNHLINNVLAKRGGFNEVPFFDLGVKKGLLDMGGTDKLKIMGHEGRHRTTALAKRGDEKTIVELIPHRSLRNDELYGTPTDWVYNDEANKHYVDAISKYFGGLNPRVISQEGTDTFNLPIF